MARCVLSRVPSVFSRSFFCLLSFSGGIDVQFGLSDYIQSMALPSWVWSNGLDFPRLYSWDQKARDELLELLKYDKSVQQRGLLNLELPDFQNLSFPNLCDSKKYYGDGRLLT